MKIISRIRRVLKIRRQRIFYLDNPNDITTVNAKVNITISELTFDNVERVTDFRGKGFVTAFDKFLKEGQYGVYAWLDSKVVGHAWAKVCRQSLCRVNGYMNICKGEAFIHYCNVSETRRGQGIYPVMLVVLCRRLFYEASVCRIVIDTETDNIASLHGIAKVGFHPLGTGIYIQLAGHLLYKHLTWDTHFGTMQREGR